jgi:aryl-alcohol dehydrogenase-like predicted oxidoreductase
MNQIPFLASPGTRTGDMLYRALGRTGERVSAIGMGGFHLAQHGLRKKRAFGWCAPPSIAESHSWITVGTITKARVNCVWAKP